jgi:hypothetical protein
MFLQSMHLKTSLPSLNSSYRLYALIQSFLLLHPMELQATSFDSFFNEQAVQRNLFIF